MKKKFNVIDLIVILFICAVVIFVAFKFTGLATFNNDGANTTGVVYTVKVGEVIQSTADAIPESGKLYDEEGTEIGEIISKKVNNSETNQHKADGSYVKVVNPGKVDVYLEVSADAVVEKEGYFINGKKNLGAGSNARFKAKNIEFEAYVAQITEK